MPPDRAPSTTTRWLTRLLGAALMLAVVSCGSDSWGVKESDVPSEATLAFLGAELTSRGWNPGDKGTYLDGGSADYAPRLTMDYDIAPTAPEELLEWYTDQLQALGYTIETTELPSAKAAMEGAVSSAAELIQGSPGFGRATPFWPNKPIATPSRSGGGPKIGSLVV